MNIAAYCRVSTDKTDQLNSLETQKRFFSEFTEKKGYSLVKLYADEGISGTSIKNRRQFLQLMRDAEKGLFDMVVVKDISRFARNTVDFLQSIRALKALGIETTFLTANMSVLGNSEFVLTIFGALAQEESANTSKRIKFGKRMNAEKGRVPNIVFGYNKIPGDYFSLEINAEEADTIRKIFSWYIDDGYGGAKIAGMLNEHGINTKRGCNWSQNAVCRILTNELYTGKVINGKQEIADFLTGTRTNRDESDWFVTDNPELKIVDHEVFERAGRIMRERGQSFKADKARQSNQHLFSTLIKCKACGYSFRRMVRTYKKTYVRWVCSGHNGSTVDCCNGSTIDEEVLIKQLDSYFVQILKNKKNVTESMLREYKRLFSEENEKECCGQELTDRLSALKKKRQKYVDMYKDDIISRKEMNDAVGGIMLEIQEAEKAVKLSDYNITQGAQLENLINQTFDSIESFVSVCELTNAELKSIIKKIEVDGMGNVDVILRAVGEQGCEEDVRISNNRT